MNPETRAVTPSKSVEGDCRFYYAYRDPGSVRLWYATMATSRVTIRSTAATTALTVTVRIQDQRRL